MRRQRRTALVVDDSVAARQALHRMLGEAGLVELLDDAADATGAVAAIEGGRPDVVLIAEPLAGVSAFEVLARVGQRAGVIVTSSSGAQAVRAFEVGVADYLVKPFGSDRLRLALKRALASLREGTGGDEGGRGGPRAGDERARESVSGAPQRRIFVQEAGRIVPIALADVGRFEARENYVLVHAGGRTHLLRTGLGEIGARLDPAQFLRVHRSHIVNLDHVAAFAPFDAKRLVVEMKDGSHITASRAHSARLRRLLD